MRTFQSYFGAVVAIPTATIWAVVLWFKATYCNWEKKVNQPVRNTCQDSPDDDDDDDDDALFEVVQNGLLPHVSPIDVRAKLADLFKVTPEQIDTILATPVYRVRRIVSSDVAAKYKRH